jgi:glucose/arabinose dehydrogenase
MLKSILIALISLAVLAPQGVGTVSNDDVPTTLASLPANFLETQISGLSNPTAMALHPDGRIFVCQQTGALRVIKNGVLLATPFTTLTVDFSGERGLLGIAFDPNYATNRFIYVYYTATTPTTHNRVSRFTADIANEDIAVAGSEVPLLDLETLSATNHNGGAIHFGPDGKLYVAVGDNAVAPNSQSVANRLGKILRINSDGTIPADNPTTFPNIALSPTGNNRAIWAVGLRNPFTFSFQAGTGRMHINDVGQSTWEEISVGAAGANYGWPTCEGACGTAGMTNPIYQYSLAGPDCAITGGGFYNPTTATFPAQYIGKYFLADFCGGWLKTIDPLSPPTTGNAAGFATGISSPVDVHVANDGSLYYLARGPNSVFRVQYVGGSTIAISDVTSAEGNSGTSVATFNVLLSPASAQTVTVQYTTADNTASAGSDYIATSGTLTFAPGQVSQPVNVTINGDTDFESTEVFNVNLSNATNASIADNQGIGTITNDDGQPALSIDNVSITEGNSGTTTAAFTVSLSSTSSQNVTVNYATANGTATSGSDFVATSGTATITAGQLSTTVNVTINGDTTFEANETFFVNLTNPVNATISDNQGIGTINNNDSVPSISINDVSVTEGNAGSATAGFTVSLTNPSDQTITVNYATAAGTATADSDYATTSASLTFTPGQISQPVSVTINGDTMFEPNEVFTVNLSNATNANLGDTQGVGTITNDDPQPTISINDVSVTEGNTGSIAATFTVSLSNASSQTISASYAVADGSAVAGSDYVTTSGTVTFTPGQLTQPISVTVNGDTLFELAETFNLNLTSPTNATIADNQGVGTITNDDAQPTISINDVTVTEGNSGTIAATFNVSLSGASSQTTTVNYATAVGSATAGSDYLATSGTVTFSPSQLTQSIAVTINGDTMFEPNESFNVNLSNASNATIADNQGIGTITNDDTQPTISIDDVSVNEGNAGTTPATFTVSLSNASSQPITVNYATANATAIAGVHYVSTNGTLTFTSGQTSQSVNVAINGDQLNEDSVAFNLNLSLPSNAIIVDNQGIVTINDDDAPVLGTEENSQRAIALDTVTFVRDPFVVNNPFYFGPDHRTRVTLVATNLTLTSGLVVTARGIDSLQTNHDLPVEFVGPLPGVPELTQVVVKLPDGILVAGDLQLTITVRGKTSNVVLVGVKP